MMGCVAEHPYRSGRFGGNEAVPLRPGGLELTRRAAQYAGFTGGQWVLDLGCGEGKGTQWLCELGCRVIGLDVSWSSLATAAAHLPELLPITASASRLPFGEATFDGIIAECSLSLVEQRRTALAECCRVLRPGGRLAITDVFFHTPAVEDSLMSSCLAGVTKRDEIQDELVQAGFRVDLWEDHSAVLRTFMARLILESDSPNGLWNGNDATVNAALRQRRPGYYLLIASKAGKGK
jgi:arsenite methyltransferase